MRSLLDTTTCRYLSTWLLDPRHVITVALLTRYSCSASSSDDNNSSNNSSSSSSTAGVEGAGDSVACDAPLASGSGSCPAAVATGPAEWPGQPPPPQPGCMVAWDVGVVIPPGQPLYQGSQHTSAAGHVGSNESTDARSGTLVASSFAMDPGSVPCAQNGSTMSPGPIPRVKFEVVDVQKLLRSLTINSAIEQIRVGALLTSCGSHMHVFRRTCACTWTPCNYGDVRNANRVTHKNVQMTVVSPCQICALDLLLNSYSYQYFVTSAVRAKCKAANYGSTFVLARRLFAIAFPVRYPAAAFLLISCVTQCESFKFPYLGRVCQVSIFRDFSQIYPVEIWTPPISFRRRVDIMITVIMNHRGQQN